MEFSWILLFCLMMPILLNSHHSAADDERQSHIVYMGNMPKEVFTSPLHLNIFQEVTGRPFAEGSLLYSYKRSFNVLWLCLPKKKRRKWLVRYSSMLTQMDGVVSIFPNKKRKLYTTRSWDFIGFPQQVKRSLVESDIIIGMIDSGVWPESSSFDDREFGPPPRKWKGSCHALSNFTCNRKIVGAKYYRFDGQFGKTDIKSPRDSLGHGTHTASTAAGVSVSTVSLQGFGEGTARGGVPSARLAVYKACWSDGCYDAEILAAFDDAIADGVDLISVSVGGSDIYNYFDDAIAIGSFHAARKGILTSVGGGNDGPVLATMSNASPWMLSVAATTTDRKFFTDVKLGNGKIVKGISLNTFDLKNQSFPLIHGLDVPNITGGFDYSSSRYCDKNSPDRNSVKGKIVICDNRFPYVSGRETYSAGSAGLIIQGQVAGKVFSSFPLPTSFVSVNNVGQIGMYINSTSDPIALISKSTEIKDNLAPYVPTFSSRGPNPDIAAPGAQILAAWPPVAPISQVEGDKRIAQYNIISGTSMACPHATAAAAYVKSFRPFWSPAAIKSALMTTAKAMSTNLNPEAEFAYGAGQINPLKALDPSLVYDVEDLDYVKFLCGQGYDAKKLQIITGENSSCSSDVVNGTAKDLNYPAFAISVSSSESISMNRVFYRTVTNVGLPNSTYKASLVVPQGLNITVNPSVLSFTTLGQKLSYSLSVEGIVDKFVVSASLVLDDATFHVRSPIAVYLEF